MQDFPLAIIMEDDLQRLLAEAKAKRKSIAQQPDLSNRTAVLKANTLEPCVDSAPYDTKNKKKYS